MVEWIGEVGGWVGGWFSGLVSRWVGDCDMSGYVRGYVTWSIGGLVDKRVDWQTMCMCVCLCAGELKMTYRDGKTPVLTMEKTYQRNLRRQMDSANHDLETIRRGAICTSKLG